MLNPYLANGLAHLSHLGESTLINKGFMCDFIIVLIFRSNSSKQTKLPQIERRVLRRHIWGYSGCLGPTKGTPGLNELNTQF